MCVCVCVSACIVYNCIISIIKYLHNNNHITSSHNNINVCFRKMRGERGVGEGELDIVMDKVRRLDAIINIIIVIVIILSYHFYL
jgi:hypothetical protein